MASHLAEVAMRKEVAVRSDDYYSDTQSLGDIAWGAFGEKSKSQIRNLENIANSAMRVADILDFVKRQTGRSKQWRSEDFGHKLLEKLSGSLQEHAKEIVETVQHKVEDHRIEKDDHRRIHIFLCREFIHHLSAHYLYQIARRRANG